MTPEEEAAEDAELDRLRGAVRRGGFVEGFARVLALVSRADRDVEPEAFARMREVLGESERLEGVGPEDFARHVREQLMITRLVPEAAWTALPRMLRSKVQRREALALTIRVVVGEGVPNAAEAEILAALTELFEIG